MPKLVLTPSLLFLTLISALPAQITERISVNQAGGEGNGASHGSSISASGRFIAFESHANDLVTGDTNDACDIFVRDRETGRLLRVSVNSAGGQANSNSYMASISADGRFIAFMSDATNLVPKDSNHVADIFVHDLITQKTKRVNVSSSGAQANAISRTPSLSADGRFIAFDSFADNLVPVDKGYDFDVFVHDRLLGLTTRVSVTSSGREGKYSSFDACISADGRFVAFGSFADNLVAGDINTYSDIFIHDRLKGRTKRISVDSSGVEGNGPSTSPSISADGLKILFESEASNLVVGDHNRQVDVFLYDLMEGSTTRVSVDSDGSESNSDCLNSSLSADGRIVVFDSFADNLVFGDANDQSDVFVHDPSTGQTYRASVDSSGAEGHLNSFAPRISERGRAIVFESLAGNLAAGDSNDEVDIFVNGPYYNPDVDFILLLGPYQSSVDDPIVITWQDAPPGSFYWLFVSQNLNGSLVHGFQLDLGAPAQLLATGRNSNDGSGSYSMPPLPSSAAGAVLYFEVISRLGSGNFFDSNPLAIQFF